MKQLRVAILGQGRSGWKIHGKNFLVQDEMFKVVAIVDPLQERLNLVDQRYGKGVDKYTDYTQLFGRTDIDFVVNSTPSHLHVPISLDLMNYGFNVLCEKPLARSAEEVDLLIEASKKNNVKFFVFQQSRCATMYQEMKKIINSGVLGRIVQISILYSGYARRWDWQTIQGFNGGNLLNTGPHPMDHAVDLYGEGMPEVKCFMDRANTWGDAEDYCKVILWGKDKPVIDVEISSCNAYAPYNYNIQGTRGGLKADFSRINYKYFVESECEPQELIKTPLTEADDEPAYCSEKIIWHENEWVMKSEEFGTFEDRTSNYYIMLYKHLVEGGDMVVKLSEVRKQIAIMEECHNQTKLSKFIKV
ncbi:MAG: Gfo/Idh/MocA family oxidoreductase [Clostridia bacterium]|nr:Gfo/Idh/MocA family oxidoreductase [Clostridia bacterium]